MSSVEAADHDGGSNSSNDMLWHHAATLAVPRFVWVVGWSVRVAVEPLKLAGHAVKYVKKEKSTMEEVF
jgi:late competence protein required for DNA uptake (superfamily II DNA/RNA helicase)